jgi:hypothetical protein
VVSNGVDRQWFRAGTGVSAAAYRGVRLAREQTQKRRDTPDVGRFCVCSREVVLVARQYHPTVKIDSACDITFRARVLVDTVTNATARRPPRTSPCWPPRSTWPGSASLDYDGPPVRGRSHRGDRKTPAGQQIPQDRRYRTSGRHVTRPEPITTPTPAATAGTAAASLPPTPRSPFDTSHLGGLPAVRTACRRDAHRGSPDERARQPESPRNVITLARIGRSDLVEGF